MKKLFLFLGIFSYLDAADKATQTDYITYASVGTQSDDEPSVEEVINKYPRVRIHLKFIDTILAQARTNHALVEAIQKLQEKLGKLDK